MNRTAQEWCDLALTIQDACNLRGVLRSFVELADQIGDTAADGRRELAAAARLFADKVVHLAGGCLPGGHQPVPDLWESYDICRRAAEAEAPLAILGQGDYERKINP